MKAQEASPAQSYQFTQYQELDGLPNALVKGIAKDALGFVWIASDDGLIRFDGLHYQQFTNVPSNYVKGILSTKKGQLLAATDLGVVEVHYRENPIRISNILPGRPNMTDSTCWYPKLMYEHSDGSVWMSDNRTVYRYDNGAFRRFTLPEQVMPQNNYHRSFSFFEDGYGHFFACAETGLLYRWEGDSLSVQPLKMRPETVHHAKTIGKGRVLLATELGVMELRLNEDGTVQRQEIHPGPVGDPAYFELVSEDEVIVGNWSGKPYRVLLGNGWETATLDAFPYSNSHFVQASADGVWVGTDNGLVLMRPSLFVRQFPKQSPGYIQHVVSFQSEVYYTDGPAVYRIERKGQVFVSKLLFRPSKGVVLRIVPTAAGLWLADTEANIHFVGKQGGVRTYSASNLGGAIYMMDVANDGSLWFCQDRLAGVGRLMPNGAMLAYTADKGALASIISVRCAPNGDVYFGGGLDNGYIYLYDKQHDRLKNLSQPLDFQHNENIDVFDIGFREGGEIWLCTEFGLLAMKDGRISRRELSGNMTDMAMKGIAFDGRGHAWLANSKGIARLNGPHYAIFDEKDGLPSKIIPYRSIAIDHEGNTWVATISGLAVSLNAPEKPSLPPSIIEVRVNNRPLQEGAGIYSDDFMDFKFVSPMHPNRFVAYQYQIRPKGMGADAGAWEDTERANELLRGHLEVGAYTLYLRARQQGNHGWSEPTAYHIEVSRRWFEIWWVWLLIAGAVFASFRMALYLNSRRLAREKRLLEQTVAQRTRELIEKSNEIEAQSEELQQNHEELEATLENLRSTQSQLVQAEKLSSLGQLTAGIAHEINNPINFVYAGTETLSALIHELYEVLALYEAFEHDPSSEAKLDALKRMKKQLGYEELKDDILGMTKDIRIGADRTAEIVRNLRNFSRMDEGKFDYADIHEGLDATLVLLTNKFRQGAIKVSKHYGEIPVVWCMPSQINQVFMNIIANAADAIAGEGEISITTRLDEKGSVQVLIADTGQGMTDEVKKRLFDPFFTTKKIGQGTGLGLSVVYSIVEKHQGRIDIESEVGKGTTFIITLPKMKQTSENN